MWICMKDAYILQGTNSQGRQNIPQVLIQREDIPIRMPILWPSMCPTGLHQDPKASHCSVGTTGNAFDGLHRQHPHLGRVQGTATGPCHRPVLPTGEPRLCDKQSQVCSGANTIDGVPRFLSELGSAWLQPENCPSYWAEWGRNRSTCTLLKSSLIFKTVYPPHSSFPYYK